MCNKTSMYGNCNSWNMDGSYTSIHTGAHIGHRLLLNGVVKDLYREIAYRHTWEDILVIKPCKCEVMCNKTSMYGNCNSWNMDGSYNCSPVEISF
jgi:hypothetical protein